VQAPDHPAGYVGSTGGEQQGTSGAGGEGGIGDAAWNILSKAGEALKKGEEAAWRAVRNK
jgi:hypothetical protein